MTHRVTSVIVSGVGIRLERFTASLLTDRYVGWLNDPETVRYSENRHRRHTLNSCASYFTSMADGGHEFYAIMRQTDGCHIGNITIYVDHPNKVGDIAIMIGEGSARGYGLGREAWCLACEHALTVLGLRKITAGTMSENRPMLALMAAASMKIEAVRPRQFLLNGHEVDGIYAGRFCAPVPGSAGQGKIVNVKSRCR